MSKKLTPLKAIKYKCIDCIYDPLAPGTAISQVEACKATDCPLHEFRPITIATKTRMREERVAGMSETERADYEKMVQAARERMSRVPVITEER